MVAPGADPDSGEVSTSSARLPGPTVRGQVVVDGAYLLPRAVVATRRLLRGDGIARYRAAFPQASAGGRPTGSPVRVATHAMLGLLLGLATLAVAAAVVLTLLVSPLLLAPAGLGGVAGLAGLGAAHRAATRQLVDRRPSWTP